MINTGGQLGGIKEFYAGYLKSLFTGHVIPRVARGDRQVYDVIQFGAQRSTPVIPDLYQNGGVRNMTTNALQSQLQTELDKHYPQYSHQHKLHKQQEFNEKLTKLNDYEDGTTSSGVT
eukprot:UN05732